MVPQKGGMLIGSSKSRCGELSRPVEPNDANGVSATSFSFSKLDTQFHSLRPGWFWSK